MAIHRISIDIDEDEHKYLKMCCAKLGVTIKQFVINATIDKVDAWEDKWMLERWERDGTKEELEKESTDSSRTVYELNFDNGEAFFTEKTYSEVEKRAHGL
jgi:hypothetical protein